MYESTTARAVGAWNIVFGVVAITFGIAVGVGCLVAGGKLLAKF